MIRWLGEKLGLLEPPDEVSNEVRANARDAAKNAIREVNLARVARGVPSLEYDLLVRHHEKTMPNGHAHR